MKTINVVNGPQKVSSIILGCMRMPALNVEEAAGMIRTAAEEGIAVRAMYWGTPAESASLKAENMTVKKLLVNICY